MLKKISVLLFIAALMSGSFLVNAQEEEEEDIDFVSGTVSAVSDAAITVIDADSAEGARVTVVLDEETLFENVESINEIAEGDEIYIDYIAIDDETIAVNIFKFDVGTKGSDDMYMEESDIYEESYDGKEEE